MAANGCAPVPDRADCRADRRGAGASPTCGVLAAYPATGVAIFDRSWYGRVLVERVEGFCSEADWLRAYAEINDFEHELVQSGAIVAKFWLQISKGRAAAPLR